MPFTTSPPGAITEKRSLNARPTEIGESAVSQATRRIRMKIEGDKKLKKQMERAEKKLNLFKV